MSAPGSDAFHSGRTSTLSEEHERECLRTRRGLGHLPPHRAPIGRRAHTPLRRGPRECQEDGPREAWLWGQQGSCFEENTTELPVGEGLPSIVVTQEALSLCVHAQGAQLQRC